MKYNEFTELIVLTDKSLRILKKVSSNNNIDLSFNEINILYEISRGKKRNYQLCDSLMLDKGYVLRLTTQLIKKNLITKNRSGKQATFLLSSRGIDYLDYASQIVSTLQEKEFNNFTKVESSQFRLKISKLIRLVRVLFTS